MSIFGSIMSKIFHHGEASAAPAPTPIAMPGAPSAGAAPETPAPTPNPTSSGGAPTPPSMTTGSAPTANGIPASPSSAAASAGQGVDVAAVLDGLAGKAGQTLDWKHSIVDLMKLLDLDSSFTNRKALAQELHYSGDMNDSASMNIWLHKQVMQKLAENGGKVPADLKA